MRFFEPLTLWILLWGFKGGVPPCPPRDKKEKDIRDENKFPNP